jgi:DNA-binding response OmpR family regulator
MLRGQGKHVDSSLPSLDPVAGANITFIASTADLFGAYVAHLRDGGYTVSLAASVQEASTQAKALCPDLVFLDLGQSSQAGLAMLRELKADGCLGAIPLVMLASFDSLEDIQAGLELGACDYIIKTETSASALARGVPAWTRIDQQLQAGLQESKTKRGGAHGAEVAFWARPRRPSVRT